MKVTFYELILFFQWACMLASALVSLRLIRNTNAPKYMDKFYWYSIVAGLLSIYSFLHKYFNISNSVTSGILHSSLLLFHFVFLCWFIYRVLPKKNNLVALKFIFILFIFVISFCLITNSIAIHQSNAFAFTNFGLVLFCCVYYYQLFKDVPSLTLLKEPSFWIINCIFFCMCATVPMYGVRGYLYNIISYDLYLSLGSIGSFSYGIMHLFFIKAYLCSINRLKV